MIELAFALAFFTGPADTAPLPPLPVVAEDPGFREDDESYPDRPDFTQLCSTDPAACPPLTSDAEIPRPPLDPDPTWDENTNITVCMTQPWLCDPASESKEEVAAPAAPREAAVAPQAAGGTLAPVAAPLAFDWRTFVLDLLRSLFGGLFHF